MFKTRAALGLARRQANEAKVQAEELAQALEALVAAVDAPNWPDVDAAAQVASQTLIDYRLRLSGIRVH